MGAVQFVCVWIFHLFPGFFSSTLERSQIRRLRLSSMAQFIVWESRARVGFWSRVGCPAFPSARQFSSNFGLTHTVVCVLSALKIEKKIAAHDGIRIRVLELYVVCINYLLLYHLANRYDI